jgi:plasmid maintenance system antidote protein VapI
LNQIGFPVALRPDEVTREKTLGAAIELCAKAGGYVFDKALQMELGVDKAQFSRWQSGAEGVVWPKLEKLMDTCGNDAPLLWMNYQRGYDLHSLRHRETETERQNRLLREEVAALRRVLMGGAANG